MTKTEIDPDRLHRREYEGAQRLCKEMDLKAPPDWDDLTEEVREGIRKVNREHWSKVDAFGRAITSGYKAQIDAAGKALIGKGEGIGHE